jgi:hypothetical protein
LGREQNDGSRASERNTGSTVGRLEHLSIGIIAPKVMGQKVAKGDAPRSLKVVVVLDPILNEVAFLDQHFKFFLVRDAAGKQNEQDHDLVMVASQTGSLLNLLLPSNDTSIKVCLRNWDTHSDIAMLSVGLVGFVQLGGMFVQPVVELLHGAGVVAHDQNGKLFFEHVVAKVTEEDLSLLGQSIKYIVQRL